MLTIGSPAPDFSLPDQDGKVRTLSEFAGKWLVLYFYPKDLTPGCTLEACAFRDNFAAFGQAGIAILGVSKDTTRMHKRFAQAFSIPFPLLSDKATTTIQAYGAWGKKKFMGREYDGILRNTVLIDPTGIVRKIYEGVDPEQHVSQIADDISALKQS